VNGGGVGAFKKNNKWPVNECSGKAVIDGLSFFPFCKKD